MNNSPSNKKIQNAWAFYDWANSVHSLTITSAIFPIYFPIVAYHVNGLEFRREAEQGIAKSCEIGQEITVRYLSENPYEASLSDNSVPVLNPTIFFVLGFLMLLSSIALSLMTH
jgi:hypothetical protein